MKECWDCMLELWFGDILSAGRSFCAAFYRSFILVGTPQGSHRIILVFGGVIDKIKRRFLPYQYQNGSIRLEG